MTPVVVERRYRRPVTLPKILATDAAAHWCIAANGGTAVVHALGDGGRRSICIYRAPDAESMRRVRDVVAPRSEGEIWPSTEHWAQRGAPCPSLDLQGREGAVALVDRRFSEPTDFWEAQAREEKEGHCLALHEVRFLRSYLSFDRQRMLCLYAAPDVESVRAALRLTTLPFDEVLPALVRRAE